MDFTDREREILLAMSDGNTSYKNLSEELGVKPATIHTLLDRMFKKTGTHDKTALLAAAVKNGWVNPNRG